MIPFKRLPDFILKYCVYVDDGRFSYYKFRSTYWNFGIDDPSNDFLAAEVQWQKMCAFFVDCFI